MILKSDKAAIERSYTRVLFGNCAQNIEKEAIDFFSEVAGEKHAV